MQEAKQRQLSNCAALIAVCLKRVEKKKGGLMPEWEVGQHRRLLTTFLAGLRFSHTLLVPRCAGRR